jgi:hypothetical protein
VVINSSGDKPSENFAFGLNFCLPKISAWKEIEAQQTANSGLLPLNK